MLLDRRAVILPVRRLFAIDKHIDRTLAGAEGYDDAAIGADRHEARRSDHLNGEDEQSQGGEQAASCFRLSDCPQHDGAHLAAGAVAVIRTKGP